MKITPRFLLLLLLLLAGTAIEGARRRINRIIGTKRNTTAANHSQPERASPAPATNRSAVNEFAPNPLNARSWWQRLRDWLWGYDFFVSYHWVSGGVYAVNLAQRLRSIGFDVFLDRVDYASGDDWKKIGQLALLNTQRLVLVATRDAVTISRAVRREVEIFTARGRQVIPIIFGDRFDDLPREQHATLVLLPESSLFIDSGAASLSTGPDLETIEALVRTHTIVRRRRLRLFMILLVLLTLFGAGAAVTYFLQRARSSHAVAIERSADRWIEIGRESQRKNDVLTASIALIHAKSVSPHARSVRAMSAGLASPLITYRFSVATKWRWVVSSNIHTICLSPDGRFLLNSFGRLFVHDLLTGDQIELEHGQKKVERDGPLYFTDLTWSSDGHYIAAEVNGQEVMCWKTDDWSILWTDTLSGEGVKHIFPGLNSNTLFLLSETNGELWSRGWAGTAGAVKSINTPRDIDRASVSPDGKHIALVFREKRQQPSEKPSSGGGASRMEIVTSGFEHVHSVFGLGEYIDYVVFSPDSHFLAVSAGSELTVFSISMKQKWSERKGQAYTSGGKDIAFNAIDGSLLAANSASVRLWDLRPLSLNFQGHGEHSILQTLPFETRNVTDVAVSADATTLAIAHGSGEVSVWNLKPATATLKTISSGGYASVSSLSMDSKRSLAVVRHSIDNTSDISMIGWKNGTLQQTILGCKGTEVAMGRDGSIVGVASGTEFRTWDISKAIYRDKATFQSDIIATAQSDKGGWYVGLEDGSVSYCDFAGHQPRRVLEPMGSSIKLMALSPDAKWCAITSQSTGTVLRDTSSSTYKSGPFEGSGTLHVNRTVFSPDSKLLALCCDREAVVYNTAGNKLVSLPHRLSVQGAAFTADGSLLATCSREGLRVYTIPEGVIVFDQVLPYPSSEIAFVNNDTQLLLCSKENDEDAWGGDAVVQLRGLRSGSFDQDGKWTGLKVVREQITPHVVAQTESEK